MEPDNWAYFAITYLFPQSKFLCKCLSINDKCRNPSFDIGRPFSTWHEYW